MIAQLCIAFTGVIAIWLTQDTNQKRRRWACIFGLCGQPFWFWSAWQASQCGNWFARQGMAHNFIGTEVAQEHGAAIAARLKEQG